MSRAWRGTELPPLHDWPRELGACTQSDPRIFFPDKDKLGLKAKAVCAGCPVRAPCLEEALACNYVGVWGGTTERDRAALRRSERRRVRIARQTNPSSEGDPVAAKSRRTA